MYQDLQSDLRLDFGILALFKQYLAYFWSIFHPKDLQTSILFFGILKAALILYIYFKLNLQLNQKWKICCGTTCKQTFMKCDWFVCTDRTEKVETISTCSVLSDRTNQSHCLNKGFPDFPQQTFRFHVLTVN